MNQKWKAAHIVAASATGEGIRENYNAQSWEEKPIKKFHYYHDLKDIYLDRAMHNPSATSA